MFRRHARIQDCDFADLYGEIEAGEAGPWLRPPIREDRHPGSGLVGLLRPLRDHLVDDAELTRRLGGEKLVALQRVLDRF